MHERKYFFDIRRCVFNTDLAAVLRKPSVDRGQRPDSVAADIIQLGKIKDHKLRLTQVFKGQLSVKLIRTIMVQLTSQVNLESQVGPGNYDIHWLKP